MPQVANLVPKGVEMEACGDEGDDSDDASGGQLAEVSRLPGTARARRSTQHPFMGAGMQTRRRRSKCSIDRSAASSRQLQRMACHPQRAPKSGLPPRRRQLAFVPLVMVI